MRLLLDENFNNPIRMALLRAKPDIDMVRAQDVAEIAGKDDPTLLEWAAQEGRVVLTHDVRTLTRFAYERVKAGQSMPGAVEVQRTANVGAIVNDLLIFIEASLPDELEGRVVYVPVR